MSTARGRLITFEGIDGAGKSSRIDETVAWLVARGHVVEQTREPGGTPLGEALRTLLLHTAMAVDTEMLLMFAARAEHLAKRIRPALAAGRWVLSDRFSDASFAYQVGGRGLAAERCTTLERWVHADFAPDLTFLFDVDPAIAAARMAASRAEGDRFEREQHDFFARVRAAYLERAAMAASRFVVLDATEAPERLQARIHEALATRLAA